MSDPTDAQRAAAATRALGTATRQYAVNGIEVRAKQDSTVVEFYGHASITDAGYDMYGGPDKGGWIEYVDGGAFKRTLSQRPDVAFLINHEGMTLARTKAGTLKLAEDDIGLEVKANLDTRVSIVNDLVLLMEAKNLDEMSFAFRVLKQTWLDADGEEVPWWDLAGIERHIQEVSLQKGDVSVVNYGANPFTDGGVRSLDAAVRSYTEANEVDPEAVRRAIEHLETFVPPIIEVESAVIPAYYADMQSLMSRRLPA